MTEVDIILKRQGFNLEFREIFGPGITAVFGPSGSGKTSILQMISGLQQPNSGSIKLNGRTLFDSENNIDLKPGNRKIGYVFQEGRLFPHLTVEDNLKYGMRKGGKGQIEFEKLTRLLQISNILEKKPNKISGGERQRTALGRALLSEPELLLMDEPFSAVDLKLRDQIIPFILNIQRETKLPVLVVSHDLADLLKLTNRICLVQNGKCIGHGNYYDLLKQNDASEFLGSSPLINTIDMEIGTVSRDKEIMTLVKETDKGRVEIKSKLIERIKNDSGPVRIFLHADHIAVAASKLDNVSIQNQLKGVVTDIIHRESAMLCIIDAGIELAVEITSESKERLKLEKGTVVWCLFKSVAIDLVV